MTENSNVFHASRGVLHLETLDAGKEVRMRFRAGEIELLEERRKMGILEIVDEKNLGIGFLKQAILVGAAAYMNAKKKKGDKPFSSGMVNKWIDDCEDNGIEFEELLQAVVECVVGGMPGGKKYLVAIEEEKAAKKQETKDLNLGNDQAALPEKEKTTKRAATAADVLEMTKG